MVWRQVRGRAGGKKLNVQCTVAESPMYSRIRSRRLSAGVACRCTMCPAANQMHGVKIAIIVALQTLKAVRAQKAAVRWLGKGGCITSFYAMSGRQCWTRCRAAIYTLRKPAKRVAST